jgi:hypothetical protein
MDIIIAIIYLILFIIMMIFVFSIGMLKRFMPKREVVLVLVVAFLIGAIGGAFFLDPIYDELPTLTGDIEKNMPNNEEKLYLDVSSSIDTDSLEKELSSQEGFKSLEETEVTIPLWNLKKNEHDYLEWVVGNIDSHYKNYTVTNNSVIIDLEDNYTANQALKSFSDWYKIVYGGSLSYAQIKVVLTVESSHLDDFEKILVDKQIVASKVEGPVQDMINNTNSSMMSNFEFTLVCGGFGVLVAVIGIYMDSVVPAYRRFKNFITRRKR